MEMQQKYYYTSHNGKKIMISELDSLKAKDNTWK